MPALEHATWAYNEAARLAAARLPYVFGGGHGVAPNADTIPPTRGQSSGGPVGYDCSSWVSAILWHAGLLGHQEALSTPEFELWGLSGEGQYVTVWVHDSPELHHCFIQFKLPGLPHHWSAATHSGTICGWQDNWGPWVTEGYTPRRPAL